MIHFLVEQIDVYMHRSALLRSIHWRMHERRLPMTDVDNNALPDEAPEADAIEQRLEVAEEGDTGLDIGGDALSDREANPADVIEQSIVVPDPEDDYGRS
jgi:hypothetical protein